MPLLARLLALVVISVLPAITILVYNEYDLRQAREAQARQEAIDKAQALADQLDGAIEAARDLLVAIAAAPAVHEQDWAGCARLLAALSEAYDRFSQIMIADSAGALRCASASVPPKAAIVDTPHFQRALAGDAFVIGDFRVSRFTGVPILPLAVPIRDEAGRIVGVGGAGLRLDWLNRRLARDTLRTNSLITVVDRSGTILARAPNPEKWVGKKVSDHVHAHLAAAGPSTSEGRDFDGVPRIFAHVPPRATTSGLLVAAAISRDYALDPIERATERGVLLVASAGLLALLAAWLIGGHFILRPIRDLVTVAHALREGRDCRAPPSGSTEFDALGDALRTTAAALTAREAALRASERRFQRLSAAAREGVAITDGERVLEANAAAASLFGYAPDEVIGMAAAAFLAPEARELARRHARIAPETTYEAICVRKDGSRFPAEISAGNVEHDGQMRRVVAIRDLTARKQAEAALRESEERFRQFAENTGDVLWVFDVAARRLEYVSPAFEAVWGESREAVLADRGRWLASVHPDDRAHVEAARPSMMTGQPPVIEYRIVRPDGSVRWIRDAAFPIRAMNGIVQRVGGLAQDVTERKEVEARQVLLAAELDHRAKNMLALVLALVRMTRATSIPAFVKTIQGRVGALARAHALLSSSRWSGADLQRLVEEELAPYLMRDDARVTIAGPGVMLVPQAAQSLAMALHELATNAIKYGALSAPGGRVAVVWAREHKHLVLRWTETGGPAATPPAHRGTGTVVIEQNVTHQLDGKVQFTWGAPGLACAITVPVEKIARGPG